MTKQTEALKLALEALENAQANVGEWWPEAIAAIRKALAEQPAIKQYLTPEQPAQEPVAWRVKVETKLRDGSVDVGYQLRNGRLSEYDEPLYTSPPANANAGKPWVGLTDKDYEDVEEWVGHIVPEPVFYAIETKLWEKNNG